jgi:peptidyl-prolyl cis-trans isomerase C
MVPERQRPSKRYGPLGFVGTERRAALVGCRPQATRRSEPRPSVRQPLLHFLVIGLLLFVGGRLLAGSDSEPDAPIEIDAQQLEDLQSSWARRTGRVPRPAELDALVTQEIDDEILFREAVAAGLIEADTVVQRRLVQNARFLGLAEASDAELLEEAYSLDMHMTDPVVRRRLVQLMRSAVFAAARAEVVTDEEEQLRSKYEAERSRFVVAPRLRIAHVFVGRDQGRDDGDRAVALRAQIEVEQLSIEDAVRLGDPFLRGHRLALLSQRELEGYFGPQLAAEVFEVEPGAWSPPIESAYGLHLVFIEEAQPARQQPFEEVQSRVRDDWLREREQARLRRVLDELRGRYEIRVASVPSGAGA